MTLRIIDGYDYIPNTGDTEMWDAMGWSGDIGSMGPTSRAGTITTAFGYGKFMCIGANENNIYCYKDMRGRYTSDLDYVIWGARLYVPTNSAMVNISAYDSLNASPVQWTLSFTQTGNIIFDPPAGDTRTTKAWSFFPGRWFYLELKWKPGISNTGMVEIRVNTVTVLSVPAITTSTGVLYPEAGGKYGFDVMRFHTGSASSGNFCFDDNYFLDSLGAQNNDYLGNVRVKWQAPVSNASPIQWAIGGSAPAASNWESVLNQALNDTKFNYSVTPGNRDLYNIDPNLNTPYVYGIEVGGIYRQDDATQRVVRNSWQTGLGTDLFGVDHYCNGFYTNQPDISEINPDTGVAWTGAEVNALKIGPEVVS